MNQPSTPCIKTLTKQYQELFTKHDLSKEEHDQFKQDICRLMDLSTPWATLPDDEILRELEEYYNKAEEQEQKELYNILSLPFTDKYIAAEPIKINEAKARNSERNKEK